MKRSQIIIALLLVCAAASALAATGQDRMTAAEVVAAMLTRDSERAQTSMGYTGEREYVLENGKFQKRADMVVRVDCAQDGKKHFEVVSESGWKAANERVLRQMLVAESASSNPDVRANSRITPENYEFQMIGLDVLAGRPSIVLDVIPKREEKSLFRGRIWVDAEDYAVARVEGEPAKKPSFWTHKVHFVQEYRKSGDYWFPVATTSVTDARVFGRTDVNIRYFDYKPGSAARADADPPLMEAYGDRY